MCVSTPTRWHSMTDAIPEKVLKMLPRLATNHDGEVVATARAIERTLQAAGSDWHGLVDAIQSPVVHKEKSRFSDAARQVAFLNAHGHWLRPREKGFIDDLWKMVKKYGGHLLLSEKQEDWLDAIYERVSDIEGSGY